MQLGPLLRRWSVFTLVGFGGFVLQMSTLSVLTRVFGWHYLPAALTGIELAIVHNFLGDTKWTWRDRPADSSRDVARRFVRYQLGRALVLVVNLGLTAVFVATLDAPPEIANTSAVIILSLVNFYLGDRVVFTDPSGFRRR